MKMKPMWTKESATSMRYWDADGDMRILVAKIEGVYEWRDALDRGGVWALIPHARTMEEAMATALATWRME